MEEIQTQTSLEILEIKKLDGVILDNIEALENIRKLLQLTNFSLILPYINLYKIRKYTINFMFKL